jgi:hypothetical protein
MVKAKILIEFGKGSVGDILTFPTDLASMMVQQGIIEIVQEDGHIPKKKLPKAK